MMRLVLFTFTLLLASPCIADCHRHPKVSPYKGLNVTYKKVLILGETEQPGIQC